MGIMTSPALRNVRANSGITFRPDADTVLWMPGQDDPQSAVIRDRSGNLNNGAISGATWTRNSKGLSYLDYDGADDLVTVTDTASIQNIFDGGGTILFWVNLRSDGEGDIGHIFDKVNWVIFGLGESAGIIRLRFTQIFSGDNGRWQHSAPNPIPINTWVMEALTYDSDSAANDPIFYHNGAVKGSGDVAPVPTGTRTTDAGSDLTIGNLAAGTATTDGGIWGERFITTILTATQINGIYQQERGLFGV